MFIDRSCMWNLFCSDKSRVCPKLVGKPATLTCVCNVLRNSSTQMENSLFLWKCDWIYNNTQNYTNIKSFLVTNNFITDMYCYTWLTIARHTSEEHNESAYMNNITIRNTCTHTIPFTVLSSRVLHYIQYSKENTTINIVFLYFCVVFLGTNSIYKG